MISKTSESVTHVKAPKLSDSARALQQKLQMVPQGDGLQALKISLSSNLFDLTAVIERRYFDLRKRLLSAVANMRDDGFAQFRTTIGAHFDHESDSFLLNTRRNLRRIWLKPTPFKEKQLFVDGYIAASFAPGKTGWRAPLRLGRILPNPLNMPSQLAIAVLENWRRFRVCSNPECVAPLFLARRKDQKYCERGVCTQYAQRRYSSDSYYRTQKKAKRRQKRGR